MKYIKFTFLLSLLLLISVNQNAFAIAPNKALIEKKAVEAEKAENAVNLTKKELRKQKRAAKKQARMEKWMNKLQKKLAAVDFNDPVKKWMWFWIFGWGAGLLLSIIAGAVATGGVFSGGFGAAYILALLGSLAWIFGTVSLVIWLVKQFG